MYNMLTGVDLAKKEIQVCVAKSNKIVRNMPMTPTAFSNWLGPVDLCCIYFTQQYMGSHIIENASDTMLA